mgnify:FL=1
MVASADMTLRLSDSSFSTAIISDFLVSMASRSDYVDINKEPLIGTDYKCNSHSCVIDLQWLSLVDDILKLVVWYDNEWAYACRVVDSARYIKSFIK